MNGTRRVSEPGDGYALPGDHSEVSSRTRRIVSFSVVSPRWITLCVARSMSRMSARSAISSTVVWDAHVCEEPRKRIWTSSIFSSRSWRKSMATSPSMEFPAAYIAGGM